MRRGCAGLCWVLLFIPSESWGYSSHAEYQQHLFDLTKKTWTTSPCSRCSEIQLYKKWQNNKILVPGWVLVPVVWQCVVELIPRRRKGSKDVKMLLDMFNILETRNHTFKHALLMRQSNPNQAISVAKSMGWKGTSSVIFDRDVVVFDTRLMGLDWQAKGPEKKPFLSSLISVPLLNSHPSSSYTGVPKRSVFWAGRCHWSKARKLMHSILNANKFYNFKDVHACRFKETYKRNAYLDEIKKHTWTMVPRGSFPAAFLMAETLHLERLPIYVSHFFSSWKVECTKCKILTEDEMFQWFPYNDILNWTKLALAIHVSELPNLGKRLNETEPRVEEMLQYAKEKSHMFTWEYLAIYMKQWMEGH